MGEVKHECEHGQLARVCNICAYESDISDLTAERDALAAEKADCEKFLKEGERLDECLERWRADALAVLELLTQEKVKSESLAAEVAQADAEYQDAITLAQSNKDRLDVALAEVARLSAACAAKDAALSKALGYVDLDNDALISKCLAALKGTAGRNWIDATGAVEGKIELALDHEGNPEHAYAFCFPPLDWAGKPVLIVPKPEGWK